MSNHQADIESLKLPLGVFLVVMLMISLGPFLLYSRPLRQLKRRNLLTYGSLVGELGWLVQRRWILGELVEDQALLEAPELGPVVDTTTMYEAVKRIKPVPLGKQSLRAIVIPALLPKIPVIAIKMPVKETLIKLLGVLMWIGRPDQEGCCALVASVVAVDGSSRDARFGTRPSRHQSASPSHRWI